MRTLLELPTELKIEILAYLDVVNLTRIRLVCTDLHALSFTPQIWIWLYLQHLHKCNDHGTARLEEPIHSYSGQDLSRILTRWLTVDATWEGGAGVPKYSLLTCYPEKNARRPAIRNLSFVPGGRWLLADTDTWGGASVIFAFDLDAKVPVERVLARPSCQCVVPKGGLSNMSVHSCETKLAGSPLVGARSSIWLIHAHMRTRDCSNPITVWRVEREGYGGDSVLRATPVTSSFDARNSLSGGIDYISSEFGFLTILWTGIMSEKLGEGFTRHIDIYNLCQAGIIDASRPTLRIRFREWTDYTPHGCFIEEVQMMPWQMIMITYHAGIEIYDLSSVLSHRGLDQMTDTEGFIHSIDIRSLTPIFHTGHAASAFNIQPRELNDWWWSCYLVSTDATVKTNTFMIEQNRLFYRLTVSKTGFKLEPWDPTKSVERRTLPDNFFPYLQIRRKYAVVRDFNGPVCLVTFAEDYSQIVNVVEYRLSQPEGVTLNKTNMALELQTGRLAMRSKEGIIYTTDICLSQQAKIPEDNDDVIEPQLY